jgi:XTP/dITP diphosphohydrolase
LKRFLLCSTNEHKRRELERALGAPVALLEAEYPEETGETFLDNARAKARFGRTLDAGDWLLGEDSGLELSALGGAPGVLTARWAEGRHVQRALEALAGERDRRARYVCELVCLPPGGAELRATGVLEGSIAGEPHGSEGFGFDPVFVPAGESRTVAELGEAWKNGHSHRARAALGLRAEIERALQAG